MSDDGSKKGSNESSKISVGSKGVDGRSRDGSQPQEQDGSQFSSSQGSQSIRSSREGSLGRTQEMSHRTIPQSGSQSMKSTESSRPQGMDGSRRSITYASNQSSRSKKASDSSHPSVREGINTRATEREKILARSRELARLSSSNPKDSIVNSSYTSGSSVRQSSFKSTGGALEPKLRELCGTIWVKEQPKNPFLDANGQSEEVLSESQKSWLAESNGSYGSFSGSKQSWEHYDQGSRHYSSKIGVIDEVSPKNESNQESLDQRRQDRSSQLSSIHDGADNKRSIRGFNADWSQRSHIHDSSRAGSSGMLRTTHRSGSTAASSSEAKRKSSPIIAGYDWSKPFLDERLPTDHEALRVIEEELWCCYDKGITIYNAALETRHVIRCPELGGVNDVARMSTGDIVVAARKGLYHMDVNDPRNPTEIESGFFCSVVIHRDFVYASRGYSNAIRIYKQTDHWCKCQSFKVSPRDSGWITLSMKNDQLKCCSRDEDIIRVFTVDGELIQTFGTPGSGRACQLKIPYICDDDNDGSVLIADCNNSRLQVMTEEGRFNLVQLEPPVTQPTSAVYFNDNLYITSWGAHSITKFKNSMEMIRDDAVRFQSIDDYERKRVEKYPKKIISQTSNTYMEAFNRNWEEQAPGSKVLLTQPNSDSEYSQRSSMVSGSKTSSISGSLKSISTARGSLGSRGSQKTDYRSGSDTRSRRSQKKQGSGASVSRDRDDGWGSDLQESGSIDLN